MSYWSFTPPSYPVAVLGGGIWLISLWLGLASWRRRGGTKLMFALESVRFLVITLLAFTLLRPELVRQTRYTQPPEVVVLWDASRSMKTQDAALNPTTILRREEWIRQSRESHFWKPLEKRGKVLVEEFSTPPANSNQSSVISHQFSVVGIHPSSFILHPSEEGTDINEALENVLQRQTHLKAVLLLSDGDWNLGKSPVSAATRFRLQDIPIFAIGVGSETPLPDLVLEHVSTPSYGLLGEQISIPFKIQSHLPREVKTTVLLQSSSGEETRREITIQPHAQLQDSMVWSPRQLGEHTLTLKLPVEPEEVLADNNEQSFHISVRNETLKVLVVESLPRWEYRFLRNALARDPGVEMQCLLLHPGMAVGGGKNYLPSFPDDKEALSKYDVVFLGDVGVGVNELQDKNVELLKGLVEQQGSGLVFLPGPRGRQMTLLTGPLGDLMPVVLNEKKPEGIGIPTESHLILTTTGKGHLLTMLASDENRNQEIWKNLPGFYWCASAEKNRPGAEVLAVHSSLRNEWGRIPLLVTRPYGNGKVLFMGTDGAWRWRRGVEDVYHYRFWGQVVRWMAHQRHLAHGEGIRLAFSPEDPRAGETIFLQTTAFDANGFPLEKGRVVVKITSPSGSSERLDCVPVAGGWGVFKTTFVPQQGGKYKINVSCTEAGRKLDAEILVSKPDREKLGQPANLGVLKEITEITHGAFGGIQDLDRIVQKISVLPEPKPIEKRIRLWCEPWWGGLILLLLATYWTARKLAGMI